MFPAALDRGASWHLCKYRDTSSLGLILTHRAGILLPTDAARQLTELDRLSDGRLSIRFPAGLKVAANDQERLPRNPVEMFQQTDEYLVLKRLWSNDRSFDHEGPFYSVTVGYVDRRSPRRAAIPIRMGGTSGTALKFAGRHADMFELTPGTPEEVVKLMERMQVAAAPYGREDQIRFALPVSVGPLRQATLSNPETAKLDAVAKKIHVFGTPVQIGEELEAYTSIGVDEFMSRAWTMICRRRVFIPKHVCGTSAEGRRHPTLASRKSELLNREKLRWQKRGRETVGIAAAENSNRGCSQGTISDRFQPQREALAA